MSHHTLSWETGRHPSQVYHDETFVFQRDAPPVGKLRLSPSLAPVPDERIEIRQT